MAAGKYDFRNFAQEQFKMVWSKNIFKNSANPHKMSYKYILLKGFTKEI